MRNEANTFYSVIPNLVNGPVRVPPSTVGPERPTTVLAVAAGAVWGAEATSAERAETAPQMTLWPR